MICELLHKAIVSKQDILQKWYDDERNKVPFSIYASVDIRDSNYKVSSVDANIYPAGFNNICEADRESAPEVFKAVVEKRYGSNIKNIGLLTEEHTNNPYYWENVYALSEIIKGAGYNLKIAMPIDGFDAATMKTSGGKEVQLSSLKKETSDLLFDEEYRADLVISNNDFSDAHESWAEGLKLTMNPPRELGWYRRKKSLHFSIYNDLAKNFANLLDLDPWLLQVETEEVTDFDANDAVSKQALATKVNAMLTRIKSKYAEYNIQDEPSVFIKNNSGTYGLAVTRVTSGDEVLTWNNKTRTKMKAAKGGQKVSEIIIQEGIPSHIKSEDATAEPVIYMLCGQLIGGFLRTHKKKSASESLNSPGAVYKRLCMTDLRMEPSQHMLENVYGWVAKLSALAVAQEAQKMGVEFINYRLK